MGKAHETHSCDPFLGIMGSLGISGFQCWYSVFPANALPN
jgi:hypothetical protein